MKHLITILILIVISQQVLAKEQTQTSHYFSQDAHKNLYIMSTDKFCHGPSSELRLTIPLMIETTTVNNIYDDLKACKTAGGKEVEDKATSKVVPLVTDNCELNPKSKTEFNIKSISDANDQILEHEKAKLTARIHCITDKEKISEDDEKLRSAFIIELAKLNDPTSDEEEQVSEGRVISSFEFGTMKLPKYEDGKSEGFSDTKLYFDSRIDGRYHFSGLGLLVNSSFDASFYGSGAIDQNSQTEPSQPEGEDSTPDPQPSSPFPTEFNQVSDTLDANFTLRLAADACYDEKSKDGNYVKGNVAAFISCFSSSKDTKSSLGLTLTYGFINKEKRLLDEDTVNDYRALGVEYRHYRNPIKGNTNRIPDFVVSYQRAKFEQYGFEPHSENCIDVSCLQPIEDVYRYIIKLKYRLIDDKPYFIGFRLNAGPGQDDYGLTLGIRKSGKSVLDIFGIK